MCGSTCFHTQTHTCSSVSPSELGAERPLLGQAIDGAAVLGEAEKGGWSAGWEGLRTVCVYIYIHIFIWLHQILVAAGGSSDVCCSMLLLLNRSAVSDSV